MTHSTNLIKSKNIQHSFKNTFWTIALSYQLDIGFREYWLLCMRVYDFTYDP